MRIAVIDLGTNSVRFDVHQVGPKERITQLHREKLMVRLGQGVFLGGKFDPDAVRRTLQAFSSFKATADLLRVQKIIAFGTSALREAADSDRLLRAIRQRTGIQVRVISGEEEARLIALGLLTHEDLLQTVSKKSYYALIDIGGGSTEISLCREGKILHCHSFPLGTARLQQVFLKTSPPRPAARKKPGAIDLLRSHIRSVLLPVMIAEDWPKPALVVGSSGTVKVLGKILKKSGGGKLVEREDLKKLVKSMSTMTTTQLLGIRGLEAKRVDMILAGAILLEECLDALRAKRIHASEFSLRDGILDEEVRLMRKHEDSRMGLRLDDLYAKSVRLGQPELRLKKAVAIAEQVFDRLRAMHHLNPRWRTPLLSAVILRDVGQAVALNGHEFHSHYIIQNMDLFGLQNWEIDFISQLCLFHETGRVDVDELFFEGGGSKNLKMRRSAFLKLLALLRVVDALDADASARVALKKVGFSRKEAHLELINSRSAELALLRLEQRKDLFEDVFKKTLLATKR